jgi:probable HAF family extracellular repeat protein
VGEQWSTDLNNRGEIALLLNVRDQIGNLKTRVVLWSGGRMRDLGFDSNLNQAAAINDRGQVCGTKVIPVPGSQNPDYAAMFWDGAALQELGTAAGYPYLCNDLNSLGRSVGTTFDGTTARAYMWMGTAPTGAVFVPLGDLGGGWSFASAVNDRDEVVGSSTTSTRGSHAFVWQAGVMRNLTDLVNWPEPDWELWAPTAINNAGQIAASLYKGPTGREVYRAVRLDPLTSGPQLPQPPFGLSASMSGDTLRLSWTPPARSGAYVYRIEAGSVDGWADLGSLTVSGSSVTIPGVPNGTYYVRVRTIEGLTISYADHAILVRVGPLPPQAPQSFSAVAIGTTVSFTWDPPSGGHAPTGYVLEGGLAPGATNFGPVPVAGTSYSFSGVPLGTYYLRVRATNDAGTSPPSNEVTLVIGASLPGAPGTLTASRTGNLVTLTWTAPTTGGAISGYQIEAGSAPALADFGVFAIPGLSVSATVQPGTYYVRVRATNLAGTGPPSNEAVVTVP